jgi:hypothetical protein
MTSQSEPEITVHRFVPPEDAIFDPVNHLLLTETVPLRHKVGNHPPHVFHAIQPRTGK